MSLSKPRTSRAACALTLTLVFFSGAFTGAIAYNYAGKKMSARSAPFWTEAGKERSLERWKRDLNLRPDQVKEIEMILDDFTMYYRSVMSDGKSKILRILDDQQKQKFLKLVSDAQK
jgi:hypothetical protein